MKKVICIPDSFKGTLSSSEICEIMSDAVKRRFPGCETVSVPVADGGEGSVDCFLSALGGEKIAIKVTGPFGRMVDAYYGLIDGGKTAVVEMAACAGLPLVGEQKDPRKATTYGVGELMLDAAKRGCKKMIVGLGGSATNDGGTGAAAAVGVRFYNAAGEPFIPAGGTLKEIARIDASQKSDAFSGIEIVTMCDIDNPFYGENGAAYIFGPQKGADEAMVRELDDGLRHLCGVIERDLGMGLKDVPGGGAAGAMGAGMIAFFGSRLQMGIETVLDTVGFDDLLNGADAVFTGEGKMDSQSLRGKVVIGVAKRAGRKNVPVIVVAGGAEEGIDRAYDMGVTAVFSINRLPQDFSVSREHSRENMAFAMDNILRLWKAAH
ncbi:MAG: glycerate kinase [Oscillospiraceae bacterium]|jgi:glycerate kinase